MTPAIYVLRKSTDYPPSKSEVSSGDLVIMASGDVLVYARSIWNLLPGRYESIDQLKEFVSYVASGWPDDPDVARADMAGKVSPKFLDKMCELVEKLSDRRDETEAS